MYTNNKKAGFAFGAAYNRDRGPVAVGSIRLQAQY